MSVSSKYFNGAELTNGGIKMEEGARRTTRSSVRSVSTVKVKTESMSPSPRKRAIKTEITETEITTPTKKKRIVKTEQVEIKTEPNDDSSPSKIPVKSPKKLKKGTPTTHTPPSDWKDMYDAIAEMRKLYRAPVDDMGCERLAEEAAPPEVHRYQTLTALMLSSQTKDTTTAVAMRNLRTQLPGGLTIESILKVDPVRLNELIRMVGFHNIKTK